MELLSEVVRLIEEKGYEIGNVDATVIAQRPKLLNYIPTMKENLCQYPQSRSRSVNVRKQTQNPSLLELSAMTGIHRRGTRDQCTGSVSA